MEKALTVEYYLKSKKNIATAKDKKIVYTFPKYYKKMTIICLYCIIVLYV